MREALLTTTKYPMPGALTEYQGQVESWRGLPFSSGSLLASACAQLLQAQPQGVAVRGGSAVQEVTGWRWRLSRIDAAASGDGERVAEWTLDGERFTRCLVVPLDRLRAARHRIVITRTATASAAPRLVGTDAQLITYAEHGDGCRAVLRSAVPMRVRLDGPSPRTLRITAADGQQIQAAITILPDGLGMVIELPAGEAVIDLA